MRIDKLMTDLGLVPSRRQAQDLIAAGRVFVLTESGRRQVKKASEEFSETILANLIEITSQEEFRYVSRGGLKLDGALKRVGLDVTGVEALDIGLSTGGFSDCLLQAGAQRVVGLDVGHGQLAVKLSHESRLHSLEGINARELDLHRQEILQFTDGRKFGLIVIDVSFISLRLILPEAVKFLHPNGHILSLVKPQFEVGREGIGKNGIVKDPEKWREVQDRIIALCSELRLTVEDYFSSPIEGADGNQEFFVYARWS